MYHKIHSIQQINELESKKFNNPHIWRNFEITNREQLEYLVKKYKNMFAFGILYNNKEYSLFKDNNIIFVRDDSKYGFDSSFLQPPVTTLYCLKTDVEQEVFDFICN